MRSNKFVLSNDQFNTGGKTKNLMKIKQMEEDAKNKLNHLKNMQRPESTQGQDNIIDDCDIILKNQLIFSEEDSLDI